MQVLDLFGLKFFDENYPLRFRYVVFLNQLKPKIFYEKQLQQYQVLRLDEGLTPKVSTKPDMSFINEVVSRLTQQFESLTYEETKNAIIYYRGKDGVFMLSKSTLTPVVSKGIAPTKVVKHEVIPEQILMVLDKMVEQIINYYIAHWSNVLTYYHQFKRL